MNMVRFKGDEYDFVDSEGVIWFTDRIQYEDIVHKNNAKIDKQPHLRLSDWGISPQVEAHKFLFDYVSNKDALCIPELLEQYINKKMNVKTFELYDCQHKDDDEDEDEDGDAINELLSALHPYYRYNRNEVIVKMIGEYFNALLLKTSCNINRRPVFYPIYEWDWYEERFIALAGKFLKTYYEPSEKSPVELHFFEYREYVGVDDEEEESFQYIPRHIIDSPINECISELQTHKRIARMLYWVLDINVAELRDLTTSQRVWLYANIFGSVSNRGGIGVTKRLSLTAPIRYYPGVDHTQQWEDINKIEDMFKQIRGNFNNLHINRDDISSKAQGALNEAIEHVKQLVDNEVCDEYEILDLHQLLFLEVLKMIETNTPIKKCKLCGRYFIVTNLNMEYCFHVADGEKKPCNIIGSKRIFDRKTNKDNPQRDEALILYQRAYKRKYARINIDTFTKSDFRNWKKQAKTKLDEVRGGMIVISEFEKWLKK